MKKILLVGPKGVGKTSLVNCLHGLPFAQGCAPTVGGDFSALDVVITCSESAGPSGAGEDVNTNDKAVQDATHVACHIWDMAGCDGASLGKSFLRGIDAVMLVVDLSRDAIRSDKDEIYAVLDELYSRVAELRGFVTNDFPCCIVGNKADALQDEAAAMARAVLQDWTETRRKGTRPINVCTASAKEGKGIARALKALVEEAVRRPATILTPATTPSKSPNRADVVGRAGRNHSHARSLTDIFNAPEVAKEKNLVEAGVTNGSLSPLRMEAGSTPIPPLQLKSLLSLPIMQPEASAGGDVAADSEVEDDGMLCGKVVIEGASLVGKTSILRSYMGDATGVATSGGASGSKGIYSVANIRADFRLANVPVKTGCNMSLQLWESMSGNTRAARKQGLYRGADCLIMVYDLTSRESFEALDSIWSAFRIQHTSAADPHGEGCMNDYFPCVLVGNKCDTGRRDVPLEDVLSWCASKRPYAHIPHMECSALCSIGIQDIFVIVADAIYSNKYTDQGHKDDFSMHDLQPGDESGFDNCDPYDIDLSMHFSADEGEALSGSYSSMHEREKLAQNKYKAQAMEKRRARGKEKERRTKVEEQRKQRVNNQTRVDRTQTPPKESFRKTKIMQSPTPMTCDVSIADACIIA